MIAKATQLVRDKSSQLRMFDEGLSPLPALLRNPVLRMAPDGTWDFGGQDTQFSTHGIHTYVAAMIPALARKLIDSYVPAGGTVLDPFCGGGAVLVETLRSGREAIGRDVNNLAVLVSQAKTTHIDSNRIEETASQIVREAREYRGPVPDLPTSVKFWFKDYMLEPLAGLITGIKTIYDDDLRCLFKTLYSGTVRSVSLTYRNEVRLRRLVPEEAQKFNPDVFQVFNRYITIAKERVPQLPVGSRASVVKEDIRQLRLDNDHVDAILCSPPYGDERNGVNYTQFSKNMLSWLGLSREEIKTSKDMTLGWGKAARAVPPSQSLISLLEEIADNPEAVREAIAFYADYYDALCQMVRVSRQRVIIVIGNRVLHKHIVNNPQITAELMRSIGVPLETVHFRTLPTKRLPKMREFGAAINQEAILVFRK